MQITENVKAYCRTFPGNPLHERITQYHPIGFKYYHLQHYLLLPHGLQVLPPSALLTTTPMGFRYYHLQPYYYPHGLQVLPPSALQATTPPRLPVLPPSAT